jgi:hypothetical protein
VELLETRNLLSGPTWPGLNNPVAQQPSNSTLDTAQDLTQQIGPLAPGGRLEVVGAVANQSIGAGDVDWYHFTVTQPEVVTLTTLDQAGQSPLTSILTLYETDPFDPLGYHVIAQNSGSASNQDAFLNQALAPGDYFLAVSGAGNQYFHPFLANSGYPGSTGSYGLLITGSGLALSPGAGPIVLNNNPLSGAVLDSSPADLRLGFSAPLKGSTILSGTTVKVTWNANGTFGSGGDVPVPLTAIHFNTAANELQIVPATVLQPGYYQVSLAGNQSLHTQVLTDTNGTALGAPNATSQGVDFTLTFQVSGIEGGATADDTWQTAHQLANVVGTGLIQVAGFIGDDPAYNPANPNPLLSNPAADVDLYHIHIDGSGVDIFTAEVFAGRIGSPLTPGLSLFYQDPQTQVLSLVAGNLYTLNGTPATNGTPPLQLDPFLFYGLTAGDYYLAVSNSDNTPDPDLGISVGNGIFDPSISHSGTSNGSPGRYILNLQVTPDTAAPQVVSTDLADTATLNAPLTRVHVTFDKPVNLPKLAFLATGILPSVFVQDVNSPTTTYSPRLESYDPVTNTATFLMLDALPNGSYAFHLSGGPGGIQDYAGLSLVGNDPSGDYVIHFSVNGPARGTPGSPTQWVTALHADTDPPQLLGVLFPDELANTLTNGVTITRDFTQSPGPPPADSQDTYQITLLQDSQYIFNLASFAGLPNNAQPTLMLTPQGGTAFPIFDGVPVELTPGTYVLTISGWDSTTAPGVTYTLSIVLNQSPEPAAPLTIGSAPAIRVRLIETPPPVTPPSVTPPSVTPPSVPGPVTSPVTFVSTCLDPVCKTSGGSSGTGSAAYATANGIPAGLLFTFASGPQGGVTSSQGVPGNLGGDVFARVFSDPPAFLLGDGLRLTMFTKDAELSGGEPDSTVLGGGEPIRSPDWSWFGLALDGFFRLWGTLEDRSTLPVVPPNSDDPTISQPNVGPPSEINLPPWLEARLLPSLLREACPDMIDLVPLAVPAELEWRDPTSEALAIGALLAGAGNWLPERLREPERGPFPPRITHHEPSP